ncbi:retrovirus-related Pol polyprotein from transposon TNT 1-94 [Senna tora]|uniref:Retrovirus-related Pol polyprotein from transposon TNT 1-94 n=1 Tax=Senna tora TaxID=362788 RepID=A0A834W6S6_9FABA|nr:retrovirus-related Pol polyprotein from transposon TNT 1-94 [Senna tora]
MAASTQSSSSSSMTASSASLSSSAILSAISSQSKSCSLFSSSSQSASIKLDNSNFLLWESVVLSLIEGNKLMSHISGLVAPPPMLLLASEGAEAIPNLGYEDWYATDRLPMVSDEDLLMNTLNNFDSDYNVVVVNLVNTPNLDWALMKSNLLSFESCMEWLNSFSALTIQPSVNIAQREEGDNRLNTNNNNIGGRGGPRGGGSRGGHGRSCGGRQDGMNRRSVIDAVAAAEAKTGKRLMRGTNTKPVPRRGQIKSKIASNAFHSILSAFSKIAAHHHAHHF